ncbi:GGDEF domain-containing protein, partial [Mesorhizobium sp. M00.F.Ca.ET.149.01.1.1]
GEPVVLIDIDIDRFKQINDAIGYSQGDELIRAFTTRLKENMPKDAEIGRIGAGEFCVLLPDRDIKGSIERLIEKLINDMMEPYQLQSHLQSVSLSVGIVAMPKDGVDPVLILRRSNLALQNASASRGGNWSVFHAD